jgi:16S rRNA (guanine1516-N2)-methyltransferase
MVNAARIAVVIETDDPQTASRCRELAAKLDLPILEPSGAAEFDLLLAAHGGMLELREPGSKPGRGLCVDFSTLHPRQAGRRGGFSKNQPLARAVGRDSRTILDATAGTGHDAALLACMGYEVTAVERSPIIVALLHDGLARAMNDPELRTRLEHKLTIVNADARDVLRNRPGQFDAVYIDPMYPPKRKTSALAKKSIRLVRQVVGDDEDAAALLAVARQSVRRAVVKRPTYAPALHKDPTASIARKLVRYDIYVQPPQRGSSGTA